MTLPSLARNGITINPKHKKMRQQVFETETVYHLDFILSTLWEVLNIALLIAIVYFIVKLYKKIIKFLDKNS